MTSFARFIRHGQNRRNLHVLVASGVICSGIAIQQRHQVVQADSSPSTTAQWRGRTSLITYKNSTDQTRDSGRDPKPPAQTKRHSNEKDEQSQDASTWQAANDKIGAVTGSLAGFDFVKLRTAITDLVVPGWMKMLPGMIKKVQDEMSMAPWSLGWEIWEQAHDPELNPEIMWDANVRISTELCPEEQQFLNKRRRRTAKALAHYLDLREADIHPEDVPTIAMCSSGGGLRALVAGTSSYLSSREAGLFDCVTYTAGVSGSCWLQTLYYSSIGQTNHQRMIDHLKHRLDVHIAYPPAWLKLLSEAPTNKFLLSGVVEKLRGVPDAEFGLVDVYGLLLAGRLMVPRGELKVSDWDLKVSNQRYFVDEGDQPLPIYTAVRHEIPVVEVKDEETKTVEKKKDEKQDWFQWFEWTPYEFFCEELGAGIPTWAVGRNFKDGASVMRDNGLSLPEIKIPLMLGIWGSAFCATLSHYYHEVSPILKASGWSGIDSLLAEKDPDMGKVHPLDPASIPNFALGLHNKLPDTCPESIQTAEHLRLMDAGISNNLPIYPLLRPGRDVDVIVAFDVSADAPVANWIKVVEGYAKQRGIKGWPMGAGWPPQTNSEDKTIEQMKDAHAKAVASDKIPENLDEDNLGHCTVWVGSSVEREQSQIEHTAKRLQPTDENWQLSSDDTGLALVYFPFLENDKVSGVNPTESDYMSTWNFVYTPEEIDKVVRLARANFDEGSEQVRRVVRAVYERKRDARLERKRKQKELRRRIQMRSGQPIGKTGEGDHFS